MPEAFVQRSENTVCELITERKIICIWHKRRNVNINLLCKGIRANMPISKGLPEDKRHYSSNIYKIKYT